nr:polyprenyl synthetase family protein [Paenibacillus sp. NEAU-GSW1]
MFGGKGKAVYLAASSIELFVLASDILDDLQDQDAPQQPWSRAPLPVALHLAASFMTLSQQAIAACGEEPAIVLRTMEMMNRQLLTAANGQMADILDAVIDEESYFDVVKKKSAALLVLACMTGVMLSGRSWHAGVAEYALELGIAAQIENDRRDLLRWDEKSDFLQRKKTALTLYLLEDLGEKDRWVADYYEGRLPASSIEGRENDFSELCERSGAMLYGAALFNLHFNRFMELLAGVPEAARRSDDILRLVAGRTNQVETPQ